MLCGDGPLARVAELLHRLTHGKDRPFVLTGRRRRDDENDAPATTVYESGLAALHAAAGGTIVVWKSRVPDDYDQLLGAIKEPNARAQLVLCSHTYEKQKRLLETVSAPVIIPPLAERAHEIDRIISEAGADAADAFEGRFTGADHEWIRREESETVVAIEIAAMRLVALRVCRGAITQAAALLGISHSALSEWVARRTLPE